VVFVAGVRIAGVRVVEFGPYAAEKFPLGAVRSNGYISHRGH